ncbi:MAG: hypothetical protein IJY59_03995, partial [Bacteroidaceae bacterium]|nr:hypothetical protein [Bacteroidaceae bacterium]
LFLFTFLAKADAKVRQIFELPKLFRNIFQKVFINRSSKPHLRFSISIHPRFSLESGCKISVLKHIYQTFQPTFFKVFANKILSR